LELEILGVRLVTLIDVINAMMIFKYFFYFIKSVQNQ
jgi:hypothetical protein